MNNLGGALGNVNPDDYNKLNKASAQNNYTVNTYDANPDYKKAYEAAIQQVQGNYQQQRNSLNEQTANLPNQYQQERNRISNQGYQTRQALDETNAQRGLYRSGQGRSDLASSYNNTNSAINENYSQQNQAAQQLSNRLNELNRGEVTDIARLQGQEGQDLRNYALQQAQLTGNLNGQQTIAGQNNALQQALAMAGLTGKYNGQDTLAAQAQAADIANQSWNRQLALLQALQNYNLGVGQITDTLPQISGFNYGDVLKQLLARLNTA